MRLLSLLALLGCSVAQAAVSIPPVNCAYIYVSTASTGAQTGVFGSASNCTTAANNTAGDLIEVTVSYLSASGTPVVSGCTDLQGNTYVAISHVGPWDTTYVWSLYAENIVGGASNQVTCLLSGGTGSNLLIQASEYTGVATTGALDTFANGTGATNVSSYGVGINTSNSGDLLVFSGGGNVNIGTVVPGPGFTLAYQPEIYYASEYQVAGVAGSYTASISFTGPIHFIGMVVAFKPAFSGFASFNVYHYTAGALTGVTAWIPDGWGDGTNSTSTGGLAGAIQHGLSPCDTVVLHHTTTYMQGSGTNDQLIFPNLAGPPCTVTITGDDNAAVPPTGTRVVTGYQTTPPTFLPLIQKVSCVSPGCAVGGFGYPALISPACGAHDFTFQGIAFGIAQGGDTGTSSTMIIGAPDIGGSPLFTGAQTSNCTPKRFVFEHIWAAGNYNQPGPCRAITLDMDDVRIVDSYLDEFKQYGQDCEVLFQSSGHNLVVQNTWYQSATENFMCGGSGMSKPGSLCSHGQFIADYGTKHIQWRIFASNVPPVLASPGLAKLSYNSGYTFSGTGNCTVGSFNNGVTGVSATIQVTSNNPGAITITAPGSGGTYGLPPTTAVFTSNTATCTGSSANITSVLQGDNRNVVGGVPSGCVYYPPDNLYDGIGGGEIWVNGTNSCTGNGAFPPSGGGLTATATTTGPWYECNSSNQWSGPFSPQTFTCAYNTALSTGGESGGEKDTWELKNGQDFWIWGTVWSGMWASLQSELFILNGPVTNPGAPAPGQIYSRGTHGVLSEYNILRDSIGGVSSGNGFATGIAADPFYGIVERHLLLDQVSMGSRGCAGCTYQAIPGQNAGATIFGETPTISCFPSTTVCNNSPTASDFTTLMSPGGWTERHITSVNSAPSTAYQFDTSGQATTLGPPGAGNLGINIIDNVFQLGAEGVGGAGAGDPTSAQVFNNGGGFYNTGCKYWAPGTQFAYNIISEDLSQGGTAFSNTGGSSPLGGTNGPGLNGIMQGTSICPTRTATSNCCFNNYLPASAPTVASSGTTATWNSSTWQWTYPNYNLSSSSTACTPDSTHPTNGAPGYPSTPTSCIGVASDGTNPGADLATVYGYTAYTIGGQGNPNLAFRLGSPIKQSSSSVLLQWQAPTGATSCTVVVSPTEVMSSTGSHSYGGSAPELNDTVTGLSTSQHFWWYTVACADQVNGGGAVLTLKDRFQL